MHVRISTRIDRIWLVHELKSDEFVKNELLLKTLAKKYGCKAKELTQGLGYRVNFCFGEEGQRVRISVEQHYEHTFLKFDFKPDLLDDASFNEFDEATAIFGSGRLRFVLASGKCTYIEVAADFVGAYTTDFLFFKPYAQATAYGSRRIGDTYYLGSSQSAQAMVFYNKVEAPNATKSEKFWSHLLRIEARLRGSHCKVSPMQLGTIANPFLDVRICRRDVLEKIFAGKPTIVTALVACHAIGSPHAFQAHPKAKKPITIAAKANQVNWWRPWLLMKGWAKTVRQQLRFELLGLLEGAPST